MVGGDKPAKRIKWLGAHHSRTVGEDIRRDTCYSESASFLVDSPMPAGVPAGIQRLLQRGRVEADLLRQPGQNVEVADILTVGKVRGKYGPMELGVLAGIAGELGSLDRQPRIREERWRLERKTELGTTAAHTLVPLCSGRTKQAFKQDAPERRLRVDLIAHPCVFHEELIFELIDNTRADVAEGSDVIGEDAHLDAHVHPLRKSC